MLWQTASRAFDRATLTEGIGLKSCFTHLSMCDADTEVASRWYALNRYRLSKVQPILPEAPLSMPTGPQRPVVHQKLQPPPLPGTNLPFKYKLKVFYSNHCLNHCVNTLLLNSRTLQLCNRHQLSRRVLLPLSAYRSPSGPTLSTLIHKPSCPSNTNFVCLQTAQNCLNSS